MDAKTLLCIFKSVVNLYFKTEYYIKYSIVVMDLVVE